MFHPSGTPLPNQILHPGGAIRKTATMQFLDFGSDAAGSDDLDLGEPANPTPIAELVAQLTSSSTNAFQQVEILRVNVQRQQPMSL
eukprot:3777869-Amphidinium_carterae.1